MISNKFIDNNIIQIFFLLFIFNAVMVTSYIKFSLKKVTGLISIFTIPLNIIALVKLAVEIIPGSMIGSVDGWLGFLGGYTGALLALGGIYWQLKMSTNLEIEKNKKNVLSYVKFVTNYNLEKITKNNLEFQIEELLSFESRITTLSKSYDWLLNFEKNHIQNFINTYIELDLINNVYALSGKINQFTTHFNILMSNYNEEKEFLENIKYKIEPLKSEELKKHLRFLYTIFSVLSKIIDKYNSLKTANQEVNLLWLPNLGHGLKKHYEEYTKTCNGYFKMDKIEKIEEILNNLKNKEKLEDCNITIDDSLLITSVYLEVLQNINHQIQQQKIQELEIMEITEKIEIIQYNMWIISGSLTEIKNELVNFNNKINLIKI